MRINLNVPFSEKNLAKSLGAQWDANNRTWYLEDNQNLSQFKAWLPSNEVSLNTIETKEDSSVSLSTFMVLSQKFMMGEVIPFCRRDYAAS